MSYLHIDAKYFLAQLNQYFLGIYFLSVVFLFVETRVFSYNYIFLEDRGGENHYLHYWFLFIFYMEEFNFSRNFHHHDLF